ncbi:hypothetical protein MIZ03_2708 [Rhodoferax lithotrophicus]|uniref:Uncharacterized protein n=1 Tax=Rhodoferax lithotrophicus TaxID=2798804 RepID=A0ABM7MNK9_9BURK|nr:hypothetical protein MIZ03_2708 [Rhodoferax sp. MIZ03]
MLACVAVNGWQGVNLAVRSSSRPKFVPIVSLSEHLPDLKLA